MKKLIIFLIMSVLSAAVFAESSDAAEFTGRWKAEPFLTERDDGLLVVPEAYYAFPHLGITEIDVLDSGFIIFEIGGEEFRAFYEPVMLDYDNYHLICSFKDGEQLILKLAAVEDGWKYLVRIPSDSIMVQVEIDVEAEVEAVESESEDPEAEDGELPAEESPSERLFTGKLRKVQ